MRIDPVRFYTAVTAVAVGTVLAGQFAIHGYFEGRRDHRRTLPVTCLTPPFLEFDVDERELFGVSFLDGGDIPQPASSNRVAMLESTPLLRVPASATANVEVKETLSTPARSRLTETPQTHPPCDSNLQALCDSNRSCDSHRSGPSVPKPHAGSSELSAPETLAAPDDAAPIEFGSDAAITRDFIARELPDASSEEQNVWLYELKGLPPGMVRDLLRLRRKIGSNVDVKIRAEAALGPARLHREFEVADRFGPTAETQTALGTFTPVSETDPDPWIESTLAALEQAQIVILNNIANANTVGFKRSRVMFADLPYEQIDVERIESGRNEGESDHVSWLSVSIGLGTQLAGTQVEHVQGRLRQTGRELDVAIEGRGFFQVVDGDEILYTRAGRLNLDADGNLVQAGCGGHRVLEPCCQLPPDVTSIRIETDGWIRYQSAGSANWQKAGQIQTARFANPGELRPLGSGLFAATAATIPRLGVPGIEGRGELRQGCLEESNTDVGAELAALGRLHEHAHAIEEAADVARELFELQTRFRRSRSYRIRSVQRDDGHRGPR